MKSNKQRRDEIRAKRIERAAKLAAQLARPDVRALDTQDASTLLAEQPMPGMALADHDVLARYNNSYSLPSYYLDRAFTCRDCGAEEVWTAKQQKWWYEVIHAPIDSRAVRCLACRRARRARIAESMAHEGAGLLREQIAHLRALGEQPPTAQAQAEVQAALHSKWWGLRTIAIETLGRWGGPEQVAQLEALVATGFKKYEPRILDDGSTFVCAPDAGYKERIWDYQAAVAAEKALRLLRQGAP